MSCRDKEKHKKNSYPIVKRILVEKMRCECSGRNAQTFDGIAVSRQLMVQ